MHSRGEKNLAHACRSLHARDVKPSADSLLPVPFGPTSIMDCHVREGCKGVHAYDLQTLLHRPRMATGLLELILDPIIDQLTSYFLDPESYLLENSTA
jgi:hypothetical protein